MNKIMVVGQNPLELLGLKTLLKAGFNVTAETTEPSTTLKQLRRFTSDIVILDANLDGYDLVNVTTQIEEEFPEVKVVWLFSEEDEETELNALRASIDGCILKTDIEDLPRALKLIQEEEVYFPRPFLKKWLKLAISLIDGRSSEEVSLSQREKEIVALLRAGKSNQEIAQELFISPETVKTHLKNIRRKLNIKRTRQINYSLEPGLFSKSQI